MHNLSDRALKERITGAVVLVVFAILVVPIFLDGPSVEGEIVSQSVTLPGQNDQERKQQTIVLDRNRSEPVPASRTPATSQASPVQAAPAKQQPAAEKQEDSKPPEQQPVAEKPEDSKPAAVAASPPPDTRSEPATTPAASANVSTTGMWAVQLGSFSSQENAEALASSLRDKGYAAFLSQLKRDSGQLHRVRVGPQKDRSSAEAIAAQLAKSGHSGQVVPHP